MEAARVAAGIRRRALDIAIRRSGGYLGQACGVAEILATLYVEAMSLGPSVGQLSPDPFDGVPQAGARPLTGAMWHGSDAPDADRFIVSPAHYATAIYAALSEMGRLSEDALLTFGDDGSRLEMIGGELSPGIEVTSGSLGQALSVAIGRALARRTRGDTGRIWVLMSDGELQEGQTWEALQVASHYQLGNLTVLLDANGLQVDGPMSNVIDVEPIATKVEAFGWASREVDGHDPVAILSAISETRDPRRPAFIVCRTVAWHGIPSLEARAPNGLHFIRFREGEAAAALADLGMDGRAA